MDAIELVVRRLMVCLMKAALYFPGHGKVQEAAAEAVKSIQDLAASEGKLVLGIRERQLVHGGQPLYDMSLYAGRLIDALRERHAYGLAFDPKVTEEELLSLIEFLSEKHKGIERLEQAQTLLKSKGVTNISLAGMPAEISAAASPLFAAPDAVDVYQDSVSFLQDMVVQTKSGHVFDVTRALELAEGIALCVQERPDEALSLTVFKDYDQYTYNHSVNVCILTVAVANTLTRNRELLVRIGEAALLHDIGKIFIPEEVLLKPGKLTEAEYALVKMHPQRGASLLAGIEGVHSSSISAAFGHHLGYDQTGYPPVDEKVHLDTVTLTINIADVYEALTSKRPYKKSVAPDRAAAILVDGAGTQFSPALVRAFVRVLGMYPPGTRVRLASGELAVVQAISRDNLARPKVMVVSDREGNQLAEPYVVDVSEVDARGDFIHTIKEAVPAEA